MEAKAFTFDSVTVLPLLVKIKAAEFRDLALTHSGRSTGPRRHGTCSEGTQSLDAANSSSSQRSVGLDPQPRPLQRQGVPIHDLRIRPAGIRFAIVIRPRRLQQRRVGNRGLLGLAATPPCPVGLHYRAKSTFGSTARLAQIRQVALSARIPLVHKRGFK
jgi:hypothetical protein